MDDMRAFESQVAGIVGGVAGPERRVDARAITRAAADSSPRWTLPSMFSATKFVVAGVIVAVFGGFLLAGVLTQPNDEQLPAAVAASASIEAESADVKTAVPKATLEPEADQLADLRTRSDLLPGVDLVTEEVEPGVYRVVNDGVRDLGYVSQGDRSERLGEIVVGRDGSVWHYAPGETCDKCPGAFYRLGASATHRWPDSVASVGRSDIAQPKKTVVALDGTVWAIVGPKDRVRTRLMSFDGQAWKEHEVPGRPHAIDVDASGTPWITTHRRGPEVPPEGRFRTRSLGPDGSVTSYRPGTLAASPRGEVLLNETTQAFWTREGDGWAKVAHRADGKPPPAGHARIDDDGTIWTPTSGGRPGTDVLDRFDDPGWSTVAREDGRDWSDLVGLAADGSVWFDQLECEQGLLRFDGATWQQHLDGYCPTSIDYAPDGSVWVQAVEASTTGSGGPVDTFVITPDAVATVE